MEYRKPFELKAIMMLYNLMQVLINLYVVVAVSQMGMRMCVYHLWLILQGTYYSYWQGAFKYGCREQMNNYVMREQLRRVLYFFMWSRIFDLLDTVFSILRKRDGQVTFLHVYHHSAVAICEYLHNKFFAGKLCLAAHDSN